MRIAFLGLRALAAARGGVEAHVESIATRLADRGHDVAAFVRAPYAARGAKTDRGVRLLVRHAPVGKHAEAGVHSLRCSLEAMSRRFDVVHYHAIGPALFCGLPRLAGRRVVTTIHASDYEREKWSFVARGALRAGERSALRFSHAVLAVSRSLASRHGIEYLPNGVEPAAPHPPNLIRKRYGLDGGDYMLFLGRWSPAKRVPALIDAFADAGTGLRLVVAGGGGGGRAPPGCAAANCTFPGTVTGVLKDELLANAYSFVNLSAIEGLPIACLEAMAHGRACLASDISGHRELFADGRGLLRPAGTHDERVAALREMAALSHAERDALGAAACTYAHREHDWERIVDRLEAIYAAPGT